MLYTVLGYCVERSAPGIGAQNSPFCSPKFSSFFSFNPIQFASTTRMSSEISLHSRRAPSDIAGEPDRIRTPAAIGKMKFLDAEHEVIAGVRVGNIDRPAHRAERPGLRLLLREQRVEHRRRMLIEVLEDAEAARNAIARCWRTPRPRRSAIGARRRRHRNRKALFVARTRQRIEFHLQPRAIFAAHVHRQRLAIAPRPRGCSAPLTHTSNGTEARRLAR